MTRAQRKAREENPRKRTILSIKKELFANNYILYKGNGTEAALHSYETTDRNSAGRIATDNLHDPLVRNRIHELLELAGVGITQLNEWSNAAVFHNLKYGRPSQAAGVNHLQFLYKLHNALPASKKVSAHLSVRTTVQPENVKTSIEHAEKLASSMNKLISDFRK